MPLEITITGADPTPNGDDARMSKSGNGAPNSATWQALDNDYEIDLPAAVWSKPHGAKLNFTVAQGETSAEYTLKPNSPTGKSGYTIDPSEAQTGPPTVMVDP